MFKALLLETNLFKSAFKAISHIVDEIQIQVDEKGLHVSALDSSHIQFVTLDIAPDVFEEFEVDEKLFLNVDSEEFYKVLERLKKDDELQLEASAVDSNLTVIFNASQFNDSAKRTFKIRLIDLEYEHPSPPELEYPNCFRVGFEEFKRTCQDISLYSGKIMMEYKAEDEKLISRGDGEFGDVEIIESALSDNSENKDARSVYSLENVVDMLRADKFSDEIILKLGEDMPLSLALNNDAFDREDPLASLSFLLAPRIEAEEE